VVCRYQHSTLQLLPAGATVAGWVIFLPLDQRALFTAHEIFGLEVQLQAVVRKKYVGRQFALRRLMAEIVTEVGKEHPVRA